MIGMTLTWSERQAFGTDWNGCVGFGSLTLLSLKSGGEAGVPLRWVGRKGGCWAVPQL